MTGEYVRRENTPAGAQATVSGEDGVHDATRHPHVPTDETPDERAARESGEQPAKAEEATTE